MNFPVDAAAPTVSSAPPPLLAQRPVQYALLFVFALLPGIAALGGPFFVADDYTMLHRNPFITGKWPLSDIFTRPHFNHYAPLHDLLCWIQWQLFGDNALPYRAVSLLLHFLAAFGCFHFLSNISKNETLAFGATLVWAGHPMHSESVGWIAEQKTMLSAIFIFWALALYTDLKRPALVRIGGAFGLAVLGCFAKSTGIVIAPLVLLLEIFQPHGDGPSLPQRMLRVGLFAIIAVAFASLALWAVGVVPVRTQWGIADAILNAPGALLIYLKTALLPWTASFFHDLPRTVSAADPLFIGRVAALVLFAGFLWLAAENLHRRLLTFCLLGWVAGIGPMLNLSIWSYPAYDRFQYLGAPLLFVALGLGLRGLIQRIAKSEPRAPAWWLAPAVLLGLMGLSRGALFKDEITVMQDTTRKAPQNAYAHAGFANTLFPEWVKAYNRRDLNDTQQLAATICIAAENARRCWNFDAFFTMPVNLLATAGYVAQQTGRLSDAEHFYRAALANPGWEHFKKEREGVRKSLAELEQLKQKILEERLKQNPQQQQPRP